MNRRGNFLLTVAAACTVAAAGGCSSSDPGDPGDGNGGAFDHEVTATDGLVFVSSNITITVGQTVRWRNTGTQLHTVTFDPSRAVDPDNVELPAGVQPFFSSLPAGQTFTHTFNTPGVYRYICEPHELNGMQGMITVNNP